MAHPFASGETFAGAQRGGFFWLRGATNQHKVFAIVAEELPQPCMIVGLRGHNLDHIVAEEVPQP